MDVDRTRARGHRDAGDPPGHEEPEDRWWQDPDLEEPAFGTPDPGARPGAPAPRAPGTFDLRAWATAPRHRDAPGVFAYGRDVDELRLARAEEAARERPEGHAVRRALLWLLISLVAMRWVVQIYLWIVNELVPGPLRPMFLSWVFYVLYVALFAWLGRWHDLVLPYARPWLHRLDRRAAANGRPTREQWRRAGVAGLVALVAWGMLMEPFVDLLLTVFDRGALHDLQWLVRIVYNGAFLGAAAYAGRWRDIVEPYARTPVAEPASGPEDIADGDDDLWPELRDAGHHDAAARLDAEAARGQVGDVDYLRLRHLMASARDHELDAVAAAVEKAGGAACPHGSGRRDIRPRHHIHDLMTGQVRVGRAADTDRNPDTHRGLGYALEPDVLATSLVVVGPAGRETRAVLGPVVESMALQALTGAASLVVVDPRGEEHARPGAFDVEIIVGDPDSPWGLDLYGAAATADDAADRLAAAALPDNAEGDDHAEAARAALAQALAAWHAAHGAYPALGPLLDLLEGDEQTLATLAADLDRAGRVAEHDRALRRLARAEAPAQLLARRLSVLERPGVAQLFADGRERFEMRDIDRPVRVRVALHAAAHPDAARLVGRLVLGQFTQAMAAPRSGREIFTCLVADQAGELLDAYSAQAPHWARTRNAGIVLATRSMDDIAPRLRATVFGAAGCKAVVPGASPRDAEAFAEHWGKTRVEESTITRGRPAGGIVRRGRYAAMGALFGEKADGRSESVTVRTVERYRWTPSEIAGELGARHVLMSLTTADGARTEPVLVQLDG